MIFYHEDKPGEVSHRAAAREITGILSNPFARHDAHLLWMIGYGTPVVCRNARRAWIPQGAMLAYLKAAALREATRGES
jgi:hypothetical protein